MRILAIMHEDFVPPDSLDGFDEKEVRKWKTEYDVVTALRHLGHEVQAIGLGDDLTPLRAEIQRLDPHIVFNLLEEFRGQGQYVPFILGYLELMRRPFTGCNPRGLLLAHDKALAKKILRHHRVRTPDFVVFPKGRAIHKPRRLRFPLIVKSATEHGSVGIAQASIVHDEEKLSERVRFIHENVQTSAIAEEFIDGRELYVGVLGNQRLQTMPVWELTFGSLTDGAPRIATSKVKWDLEYQKEAGVRTGPAENLPEGVSARLDRICKRVFRILGFSGCARMDLRLTDDGQLYLLEPNPNPDLAHDEDLAVSAVSAGIDYEPLIQKLVNLGTGYFAARNDAQA
jgi:D-alanine-D-alanine ligase